MTIFAFVLTMIFPVIMFPINVVLYFLNKKHNTLFVFLIAFSLAALAFNFAPFSNQNTDLLRHFSNLEKAKQLTLAQAEETYMFSSLPGYFLLLKVFSYVGNRHLLPAFITLIGYFLCIFVVSKLDNNSTIGTKCVTIYTLLSCVSFLGFCSGIRQYLVFTIFLFTFYTESIKGKFKKTAWIVYFLLLTIHTTAGFMIILRLICGFLYRAKKIGFLSVFILFWGFTQSRIVTFLAENFSGNSIVDKIVEYSGFYKEEGSSFILYSYLWRFAFLLYCTSVVVFLISKYSETDIISKKYLYFAISACMFTFGGCTSYDVFARFSMFCFMIIIPLLPEYFKKVSPEYKSIYQIVLFSFSTLVLFYNLEQYRTFHFNDISDILTTNIITFLGAI